MPSAVAVRKPHVPELKYILTNADVAERVNVSIRTVNNWCSANKIPAIFIGGSWRIREDVIEWVLAHQEELRQSRDQADKG